MYCSQSGTWVSKPTQHPNIKFPPPKVWGVGQNIVTCFGSTLSEDHFKIDISLFYLSSSYMLW